MKVLFLFNAPRSTHEHIPKNHFFGMYEMRKEGLETDYLEIEQFWPVRLCTWLRKKILTMHFVHVPLFFKFFAYDVVYTSTAYGCLFLKCLFGIRSYKWVILDFNLLGTIGDGKKLKQKVFKWMISKVDGIVTISEAEKNALEIMFPHLKGKIIFAHEATDKEKFNAEKYSEGDYILTVGKYNRDFDVIVKAVAGTDYKVKIATKSSLTKHLEPLARNITSELYSADEMSDLYKEAAIVIVAVKTKGEIDSVGTLSVGEAMSMMKPVVATDTVSMKSYIEHEKTGLLVKEGDVEAMRNAIKELMENKDKRRQIAENGKKFADEYLTLDRFAKISADFIKSL